MKITNSELSNRTGIKHTKVRRWAKEFLPPDPRATLRSGYAKEYPLNEAFTICFAGYLLSDLKYEGHEARRILDDLKEWMIRNGQFPEHDGFQLSEEHPFIKNGYEVLVVPKSPSDGFCYMVRGSMERQERLGENGKYSIINHKYVEYPIVLDEDPKEASLGILMASAGTVLGNFKIIRMSDLLNWFMGAVLGHGHEFERWQKQCLKDGVPIKVTG